MSQARSRPPMLQSLHRLCSGSQYAGALDGSKLGGEFHECHHVPAPVHGPAHYHALSCL